MNIAVITQDSSTSAEQNFAYLGADLISHAGETLATAHGGLNSATVNFRDAGGALVGNRIIELTLVRDGRARPYFIPAATVSGGVTPGASNGILPSVLADLILRLLGRLA